MKKLLALIVLSSIIGCASVSVPNYIKDEHPYRKIFYASFDDVHAATVQALESSGWPVKNEADPALFETQREVSGRQTLIFTKLREASFGVSSRHTRLNAFLRVMPDKAIEVEIRSLKITSTAVKRFNNYRNDQNVDQIFKRIEEGLNM